MNKSRDTIFAVATPTGKSALAVIRISGSQAFQGISSISSNMPKESNVATLNTIKDISGELIDKTITTKYISPRSYTGEDMVELTIHGGPATISKSLKILKCLKFGDANQ